MNDKLSHLAVSIQDAANLIGCGRSKIYELIKAKEIPLIKLGRKSLISIEALKDQQTQIDACAEALAGIAPQDEVEGLLAAQMIACHSAAMECFRHAMLKEQSPEGRQMYLNCANRFTRTYALHMETLDKHRGKGQQKVTVEHVHVYRGGQAIVGNVDTGGGGSNSKDQTHAQRTHAPEQEMRSALKEDREPVPERRNEKR